MTEAAYRFSQRVDNYIKYRPRYPHAFLDLLKAECQLSGAHVIADAKSAIGILAGEHTNCTVNVAAWPLDGRPNLLHDTVYKETAPPR